jgi:hypothetical protein
MAPAESGPPPGTDEGPAVPRQVLRPERDPLWFAPLFVVAPARSHTSVITAMIGLHPEMCGFPELALFRRETVAGLLTDPPGWRGIPTVRRLGGLLRALAQHHDGEQTEATTAAARRWLEQRRSWRVADVYDHLLASVAPAIGVEKSPDNSAREDFLERLMVSYPRARFLHLTRHPVTTVESMWNVYHDKGYWNIPLVMLHQFCLGAWYFHHERLLALGRRLPPDRLLRLRSEDLLTDPGGQLRTLARWLGVDTSPAAIDAMCHPEASPYARPGPPGASGGNDAKFLKDPVPRPTRLPTGIDIPTDWVVDPWFRVDVLRLAAELGYPTTP